MDVDFRILWAFAALLVTSVSSLVMLSLAFPKNRFPVQGKTVLITGGSQGMGRAVAKLLSEKGANVVIVARNKKKLEDALRYISAAAPERSTQRFRTISADVTRPAENQRVMDEVKAWNHGHPPDIVWAIAGAAQPSLFLDASIEQLQSQMDVNYWSAAYLAQVTLREWLLPQRHSSSSSTNGENPAPRHFIMTSSTAAFVGVGGFAPYSPTKAAIRSLHDQLRSELNLYHGALAVKQAGNSDSNAQCVPEVKIHTVFPGTILTPGLEVENKSKHPITKLLEEDDEAQTDVQVAMAAVAELGKGRSLITTQNFQGAAMKATSLMGSPRDRWFVDTIFTWVMAVVWLFVSWDMERKVWKWGKEHGMPQHSRDK